LLQILRRCTSAVAYAMMPSLHTAGTRQAFRRDWPGAPRKDSLANEAAQLKEAGLSYAKIAVRLNQVRGLKPDSKDYATGGERTETSQAPRSSPLPTRTKP
jgi:hypothetical protein